MCVLGFQWDVYPKQFLRLFKYKNKVRRKVREIISKNDLKVLPRPPVV